MLTIALLVAIVVLIGFVWFVLETLTAIPYGRGKNGAWWVAFASSSLLVVGLLGFLGSFVSATGGLNWLPRSFEWPMGHVSGVVSTLDGVHVVPHTSSGRIQIYDEQWNFRSGWHVGGGLFKLFIRERGRFHVVTARGRWHYIFDYDGRQISKTSYEPNSYDGFPNEGRAVTVPTAPWLWSFSHPGYSWVLCAIGVGMLALCMPIRDASIPARERKTDKDVVREENVPSSLPVEPTS